MSTENSNDRLWTPEPSMQQLVFLGPDQFEWQEISTPRISGANEALVRPLAVTRCDLDLYIANGLLPLRGGFAFGHEIAGEVIATGSDVRSVNPGDRVIVPFQISCGDCVYCARGESNACVAVPAFSAYGLAPSCGKDWGGGLADVVHVPFADAMLVRVPADLSMAGAAALSDNAVDGFRTVHARLKAHPGAPVLVLGGLAQSVGLYAVQAALALGAEHVLYCDDDETRRELAARLGAQVVNYATLADQGNPERFSVVVDAACYPEALTQAMHSLAPCGSCISVSNGVGNGSDLPLREMYMKGVSWEISRVHARGLLDAALDCRHCGFDPAQLISRSVAFEEAGEAMCDGDVKLVFERR